MIDDAAWRSLQQAATDALQHSYSPYSNFPVGAAALVDDGRVVTGALRAKRIRATSARIANPMAGRKVRTPTVRFAAAVDSSSWGAFEDSGAGVVVLTLPPPCDGT